VVKPTIGQVEGNFSEKTKKRDRSEYGNDPVFSYYSIISLVCLPATENFTLNCWTAFVTANWGILISTAADFAFIIARRGYRFLITTDLVFFTTTDFGLIVLFATGYAGLLCSCLSRSCVKARGKENSAIIAIFYETTDNGI
jgi:hypothetical protein